MRRFSRLFLLAISIATVGALGIVNGQPTLAQGPFQGRRPSINAQAFNACTTTNYADIAAKSLNITAAVLRKDIVAGQTLQDIATSANVPLQTVTDALQTARQADIDQAVKDGVLTQDDANAMLPPPGGPGTAPAPAGGAPGTRPAPQGGGPGGGPGGQFALAQFPDISNMNLLLRQASGTPIAPGGGGPGAGPRGGGGFGFGNGLFNVVKQYAVAAQPLNMKCTDLVKTLITPPGKSIVAVAADQKVDPQTVTDALSKAYKDALAQDVTDTVITQAQSDQLSAILDKAISTFVNNPLPMGPQGTPQAQ